MPRVRHVEPGAEVDLVCARRDCGHLSSRHKGPCGAEHYDPFSALARKSCTCPGFVAPPADLKKVAAAADQVVQLRLRWHGDPPRVGDHLMSSSTRARFAYKVVSMASGRELGPEGTTLMISAERVLVKNVPKNATVHPFKWDPRSRKEKNGTGWGAM